ncbi:hypothetical protein NY057_05350 [Curtobacterium flaccumfaciens]|jgi:hypothetical protein|uniref:hypothetical protein n=1 Tax=Curtobacterium flaccumfaciens TaxID=2035 RepID=UPI002200FFF3|nr:hypothetical protein [Curtobacterium flaccumfaciens]UWD83672.1 hypothetical protein NY057_05350 [Curtobacterium flaccumfaciens]
MATTKIQRPSKKRPDLSNPDVVKALREQAEQLVRTESARRRQRRLHARMSN